MVKHTKNSRRYSHHKILKVCFTISLRCEGRGQTITFKRTLKELSQLFYEKP